MALDKLNHNYEDPLIVSNLLVNGKTNSGSGGGGGAPAGGTEGQVLTKNSDVNYDASWQTIDVSATTVSDAAPENPNAGDAWFNSLDGNLYIYYSDADSSQWVQATSVIANAESNPVPAGSIMAWANATAPQNWLVCDGSAVARATYPALFAAIGTTYGLGDNATTFNLPDLRGRVPVGLSTDTEFNTIGKTGGAKTHTLLSSEIPAHTHPNTLTDATVASSTHTHYEGDLRAVIGAVNGNPGWLGYEATTLAPRGPTTAYSYTVYGNNYSSSALGFNHHTRVYGTTAAPNSTSTVGITNANNTGGGGAHNNLQPYITITYIIKASAGITPGDSALASRVGLLEVNSVAPIKLNGQTLSSSYAIPAGYNGLSVGPITIANGVTITVPDGSAWSIV